MQSQFTNKQGATLAQLARATLNHHLAGTDEPEPPGDPVFFDKRAVFVTLTLAGKLRGCIGSLLPVLPLWESVRDNAVNAALNDHRFSPLTAKELERVSLEVSVLTLPEPLSHSGGSDLAEKLRPGVDGVILKKDGRSATFLPQVWEQLTTPELFLDHLCAKAGLPEKSWCEADVLIETYQVVSFTEGKI